MSAVLAALKSHARLALAAFRPGGQAGAAAHGVRRLRLGSTPVHVRVEGLGGGLGFVNVHENETTSVQAARLELAGRPGTLVTLQAQGTRLISFRLGWRAHTLDPNRIFTDAGLAATLAALGPDTAAARDAGRTLREAVLACLSPAEAPVLVALHNNEGGRYSIDSYAPDGVHGADAARVHVGQRASPHDFFVVTTAALFEPLAADGFNVVQQAAHVADDGSLSVWAQRAGRPYVNVEALAGRLDAQRAMIGALLRHFDHRNAGVKAHDG